MVLPNVFSYIFTKIKLKFIFWKSFHSYQWISVLCGRVYSSQIDLKKKNSKCIFYLLSRVVSRMNCFNFSCIQYFIYCEYGNIHWKAIQLIEYNINKYFKRTNINYAHACTSHIEPTNEIKKNNIQRLWIFELIKKYRDIFRNHPFPLHFVLTIIVLSMKVTSSNMDLNTVYLYPLIS